MTCIFFHPYNFLYYIFYLFFHVCFGRPFSVLPCTSNFKAFTRKFLYFFIKIRPYHTATYHDLVLISSTETGLQRALNRLADACDTAGINMNTAKTEVLHLSRNPDQCVLQVNGVTLKPVDMFKYLGVAFTSDERQDEELDTRIGRASAVTRASHYSVVMQRDLSKKAKLSIFQTLLVPTLTYGQARRQSCVIGGGGVEKYRESHR